MEKVTFYKIDTEYLKKLRKQDSRVSLKNNRAFVGVLIEINKQDYCIPLTSTIIPASGKKRHPLVTINILDDENKIIACLLLNNMIPIKSEVCERIDFNLLPEDKKRYHIEEYVYISQNCEEIFKKANSIYNNRIKGGNSFLNLVCCDYELLEENI